MTFCEAYKIVCENEYKAMDFCDSEYYYGGNIWEGWCEKSRMNVENPNIIGNVFYWKSELNDPYYRMRGKPVTEEQAKEIILRTHFGINIYQDRTNESHISTISFNNWWIDFAFNLFGWCHPDGTIGINGMMMSQPNSVELLEEMYQFACEFPFLDFVALIYKIPEQNFVACLDKYNNWYRNYDDYGGINGWKDKRRVALGIHLKNGHFDFLPPDKAMKLYREYAKAYEPKGIDENNPQTNPYDIYYYTYRENLRKLLKYSYIMEEKKGKSWLYFT
jgi:hypothetical protein